MMYGLTFERRSKSVYIIYNSVVIIYDVIIINKIKHMESVAYNQKCWVQIMYIINIILNSYYQQHTQFIISSIEGI